MIVDFFGALVDLKTIIGLGGGLTALSNLGALPKVGAGRALTLYMKSRFTPASPFSVRAKEISFLRSRLASLRRGHYLVVTGGKGLGKSCLIDSVLSQYGGVIKISVRCTYFENILMPHIYCLFILSGQIRRRQRFDNRQSDARNYEYSLTLVQSLCKYEKSVMVL